MKRDGEVTTFVARHIQQGHEKEFTAWMHRLAQAVSKQPGFRGVTVITPPENSLVRYVVYKFANKEQLREWEHSETKKRFIMELRGFATQHYVRASGLETWFTLHEHTAPPKWKMFLVAFSGVYLVSLMSRWLLAPYTSDWSLLASSALYGAITVAVLTWFYMPRITALLRAWLYPAR